MIMERLIYLCIVVHSVITIDHVHAAFSCSRRSSTTHNDGRRCGSRVSTNVVNTRGQLKSFRRSSGSLSRDQYLSSADLIVTAVSRSTDVNQSKEPKVSSLSPPSSSSSSSPSTTQKEREQKRSKIEFQTMSRIALPSLILASICYTTFPTIASTLAINIHDAYDGGAGPTYYGAETLNLILNDNSNQFIQNMHNFCALLFSLLTGYTFAFVYRQQEKVYYALFEEVSAVTSLLEQIALATEGRSGVYRTLLENVRTYVRYDMRMKFIPTDTTTTTTIIPTPHSPEDIPALLLSTRPTNKAPLETILYITSVGTPNPIYSTIRQLRQARSRRLAAMQRKIPEINLYMLYILGSMAFVTFPIIAAGSSTVGGDALLNVQRVQLSLGVAAMGGVLGVVNELKVPGLGGGEGGGLGSVYDVDFLVLETLLDGLEDEISLRMRRCDEIEVGGKGGGGGDEMVSNLVANTSLTANSGIDGDRSIASTNHERRIEDDDRNNDTEEIRRKPRMFRRLLDKIRRRRS